MEKFEQGIEMASPTIHESDFAASDMTIQSAHTQSSIARSPFAVTQAGNRDLVVFTGTHKTGSTALHRYLAANRQILADLESTMRRRVPSKDFSATGNHSSICCSCGNPTPPKLTRSLRCTWPAASARFASART